MDAAAVTTSSESVGKDRLKVRVEVPEDALRPAIEAVYKRWASEIKVPGFRKGKVPRPMIDSRIGGPEVIREEALRDALPNLYREALKIEEVDPIAPPDIEVVNFEAGSPIVFEATVDVRPEIDLPDISSLEIEAPSPDVTEEDIDGQLEKLRDRFAELETVSREARRGDHVLIDLKGYQHEQPVEGASAPDYLYEVGSRSGPPRLDEELEGNRAGAILKFTDTMPEASELAGQDISFTVLIKEVKAKKLPPLDDDFAKTVGDFDTLDALRDDLRERLGELKAQIVRDQTANAALQALVESSHLEPPEKLVDGEFEHRLEHFQEDLQRAGMTMEDYGAQAQLTELEIRRDIRSGAARSVKAELLLEELAGREQIEVTEEDLGREIAIAAAQSGRDAKELAEQLASSGRLGSVAADVLRRKALDFLVDNISVKGRPAEPPIEAEAPEDGS